jgi:hypothetical protein
MFKLQEYMYNNIMIHKLSIIVNGLLTYKLRGEPVKNFKILAQIIIHRR